MRYNKKQIGGAIGAGIGVATGLISGIARQKQMKKLEEDYKNKLLGSQEDYADTRTNPNYFGDRDSTIAQKGGFLSIADNPKKTSIELEPVNIYGAKDDSTHKQLTKFSKENPNNRDGIWNSWEENGKPNIQEKDNSSDRASYNIKSNKIKADNMDDYVEELTHANQFNNNSKNTQNAWTKYSSNFPKQKIAGEIEYNIPGTIENTAHNSVNASLRKQYGFSKGRTTDYKSLPSREDQVRSLINERSKNKQRAFDEVENNNYNNYSDKYINNLLTNESQENLTQRLGGEENVNAELDKLIRADYKPLNKNNIENSNEYKNILKNKTALDEKELLYRQVNRGKLKQTGGQLSSSGEEIGGKYHSDGGTPKSLGNEVVEMEKNEILSKLPDGTDYVFSRVIPNKDKGENFADEAKQLEKSKGTLEKKMNKSNIKNTILEDNIELLDNNLQQLAGKQEQFKTQYGLNEVEYIPELEKSGDYNNDGINDVITNNMNRYKKKQAGGFLDFVNKHEGTIKSIGNTIGQMNPASAVSGAMTQTAGGVANIGNMANKFMQGGGMPIVGMANSLIGAAFPSQEKVDMMRNNAENFQNPYEQQMKNNLSGGAMMQMGLPKYQFRAIANPTKRLSPSDAVGTLLDTMIDYEESKANPFTAPLKGKSTIGRELEATQNRHNVVNPNDPETGNAATEILTMSLNNGWTREMEARYYKNLILGSSDRIQRAMPGNNGISTAIQIPNRSVRSLMDDVKYPVSDDQLIQNQNNAEYDKRLASLRASLNSPNKALETRTATNPNKVTGDDDMDALRQNQNVPTKTRTATNPNKVTGDDDMDALRQNQNRNVPTKPKMEMTKLSPDNYIQSLVDSGISREDAVKKRMISKDYAGKYDEKYRASKSISNLNKLKSVDLQRQPFALNPSKVSMNKVDVPNQENRRGFRKAQELGVNTADMSRGDAREANRLSKKLLRKDEKSGGYLGRTNILNDYAGAMNRGETDKAMDVFYDTNPTNKGIGGQRSALAQNSNFGAEDKMYMPRTSRNKKKQMGYLKY